MAEEKKQEGKEDPVERAAEVARIVVWLEQAYDVMDELANNPEAFEDSLAKISRLVVKVTNDLIRRSNRVDDECKKKINDAINNRLGWWSYRQDTLFNYIKNIRKESEKDWRKEIKRFAAYSLAPDKLVLEIKDCLGE
ncbi:MAG: hypothetical protein L7H08_04985 [Vulcanisaeta sp.]|nr:hypothetical protein [Vulcanisaeta sp.]